jgi:hypothetical protein
MWISVVVVVAVVAAVVRTRKKRVDSRFGRRFLAR